MTSDRYVPTQAIREAVKGRETEVLDALGIAWADCAPHISCPYPDHSDENPSWRWNERRAKAYCTCIEGSQSIFDVVMGVEGVEFDPAKLRVAEILGRQDLIKVRDGERHQAMDAASLLRPPADQRDECLARSYLAHRLNLTPDQVPMPSTPVVAWRSLAYFDPPAKRGGQPKLVGHYPCVVFGTRSPDGRRHAHRIYVGPEGAGKAELGRRTNGQPRDAKKSATLRGAKRCRLRRPLGRSGEGATPYPRRRDRDGGGPRPGSTGRDRGRRGGGRRGPIDRRYQVIPALAGQPPDHDCSRPGRRSAGRRPRAQDGRAGSPGFCLCPS